jgi:cytoskeletal protein RodZ
MVREDLVEDFGKQLRREREERGVAFDAICKATKVPAKHIRALEAGAIEELPGGVFRRGFVRSYLGALGLEEDPWMRRFEESCRASGVREPSETEWAKFAQNVRSNRGSTRSRMRWKWLRRLGIVVAFGLAAWCGWRLATHRSLIPATPVWGPLKSWVDNATSR